MVSNVIHELSGQKNIEYMLFMLLVFHSLKTTVKQLYLQMRIVFFITWTSELNGIGHH